eukprot:g39329.t1
MTLVSKVKENPTAFYIYIKNKRITWEKVEPLKDKGGNLCLEAEDVGEILNEYFVSVFTQEKDMEDIEISMEHANMPGQFEIKKEVVLHLLKSIKVDKFLGPNGIYLSLLREAKEEIAGVLTHDVCIFASYWRGPEGLPVQVLWLPSYFLNAICPSIYLCVICKFSNNALDSFIRIIDRHANLIESFITVESEVVDSETGVLNFNKGNYEDM